MQAVLVFCGVLAAGAEDGAWELPATERALAFDLAAAITHPERRGRAVERYDTARADKAEWVRQTIKKADPEEHGGPSVAALYALLESGALEATPAAAREAEAWSPPGDLEGAKFSDIASAFAWRFQRRRALAGGALERDPGRVPLAGRLALVVADVVHGPRPDGFLSPGSFAGMLLWLWAGGMTSAEGCEMLRADDP
jgi:hypothetical protein